MSFARFSREYGAVLDLIPLSGPNMTLMKKKLLVRIYSPVPCVFSSKSRRVVSSLRHSRQSCAPRPNPHMCYRFCQKRPQVLLCIS